MTILQRKVSINENIKKLSLHSLISKFSWTRHKRNPKKTHTKETYYGSTPLSLFFTSLLPHFKTSKTLSIWHPLSFRQTPSSSSPPLMNSLQSPVEEKQTAQKNVFTSFSFFFYRAVANFPLLFFSRSSPSFKPSFCQPSPPPTRWFL